MTQPAFATRPRPRCVCCGKPAAYRSEMKYRRVAGQDVPPELTRAALERASNGKVTSYRVERIEPNWSNEAGSTTVSWHVWDGESYARLYEGLFCTLRCALTFAARAYRNGFRTKG